MKNDPNSKAAFADYPAPNRESNARWKWYEDFSKAATASSLVNPILVNCFTASTSSLSGKSYS